MGVGLIVVQGLVPYGLEDLDFETGVGVVVVVSVFGLMETEALQLPTTLSMAWEMEHAFDLIIVHESCSSS